MFNKIITYHDGLTYTTLSERSKCIRWINAWRCMAYKRNIDVRVYDAAPDDAIFFIDYTGRKIDIISWYLEDYCASALDESFIVKLKTVFKIIKKKS